MDLSTSTLVISTVIGIIGLLITISNFMTSRKKDCKTDEARLVRMETMLVNIDKNTTEIRTKLESHDKLLTKHESRISVLENSKSKKRK
jgi:hypothetical protein